MKSKLTIIIIAVVLGWIAYNVSQDMNQIENNYTTVKNDPMKSRIYTLDNGLKVYLTVYKDAPRGTDLHCRASR